MNSTGKGEGPWAAWIDCVRRFASTLGMALGPLAGGWLYDAFGSYAWLFIGSCGIGLWAVAIASTFRPPRALPAALPALGVAH